MQVYMQIGMYIELFSIITLPFLLKLFRLFFYVHVGTDSENKITEFFDVEN